ncbi:MAG TPA: hypothetical protein VN716_25920 [Vicinamibacterales bacterium]|jgi:hypothetical protein|nr:hypothetical protein [Vicinamibacterales bacterium]
MRILRGLTSRLLPCGCVAGIYETYDGQVVALLDERQASCRDRAHRTGSQIPELAVHPTPSDAPHGTGRRD